MLVDTHAHLDDVKYESDLDEVIARAAEYGVTRIISMGDTMTASQNAVKIAEKYDGIFAGAGVHPQEALSLVAGDYDRLAEMMTHPKVKVLGEIGLDYYWDTVSKEKQLEVFQWQMDLAKKHDKPVIIHCRDAYEDTYEVLKRNGHRGIMHCYSGSVEMAKRFVELGFYISLAGPVTFKNARVPKDVAANINIENLLIETDCPYLTPHPFRGKLNEPANVVYIAQEIAKLKNMEIENVASKTTFNAKTIFGIK